MPKKRKKTPLKTLRKRAYKAARAAFARWIVKRDRGRCFSCGRPGNQAGHFIHKDCLDFDEIGNNCQDVRCNHFLSGNLGEYAIRLIEKYGKDEVDALRLRANQVRKFSLEELQQIFEKYTAKLKELEVDDADRNMG